MRLVLAIRCFFLILFAARLPEEALRLLPAPEPPALPPGPSKAEEVALEEAREAKIESDRALQIAAEKSLEVERARSEGARRGAIQILGLLQREGRLIDFFEEAIDSYSDQQIGASVRDIHKGCKRALAEHVDIKPVLLDGDNATVKVEAGFDPSRIRLVGNVVGSPPFSGALKHPGWRGATVKLPELPESCDPSVIAPAEVELG